MQFFILLKFYLVLLALKLMNRFSKILFFVLTLIFLISSFLIFKIFLDLENRNYLKIIFLDVGQGDSIFIETPSGFQTIVDGGPNSVVIRSLSKFLPFYDRQIDFLIASHSDSDHVAGFVELIKRFKINFYGQNFIKDGDSLNQEILNLINQKEIDQYYLGSGDKIILDQNKNIYLEILWPPSDHQEKDNNDNSLVIRIVYDQIKVLLTGDISVEIENKLVNFYSNKNQIDSLKSEILKAGHHGSKTSTSKEFLDVVNPNYIIISAGKDNRFGHPHQDVLDRINNYKNDSKREIEILETSIDGSIYFQSDGREVWLVD